MLEKFRANVLKTGSGTYFTLHVVRFLSLKNQNSL